MYKIITHKTKTITTHCKIESVILSHISFWTIIIDVKRNFDNEYNVFIIVFMFIHYI